MTRERWEVTAVNPDNGEQADEIAYERHESATARAKALRRAGWVPRIVHIRTYRVEVVYAWRMTPSRTSSEWWSDGSSCVPAGWNRYMYRTLFTDPLGKHSRRRAKAAALAAKPTGPCVLAAIRRRVRE